MDSLNPSENAVHSVPDKEAGDRQTEQPVNDVLKTDQQENANATAHTKKKKRPTKHFVRISNLVIQGLLLFVGVGYSWFAWKQWTVMRQQLQMSRLDQRAWVAESEISGVAEEGKPYKIKITVKNTGKTFATKVSGNSVWQVIQLSDADPDFEGRVKEEESTHLSTPILIPPNGTFAQTIDVTKGRKLRKEDVEVLQSPTEVKFAFGRVRYLDIFGCKHWTTYCYRVYADGTFEKYGRYNDADNNCGPPKASKR